MGNVTANDIIATMRAVERSVKKLGNDFGCGEGPRVAQEILETLL